MGPNRLVPTNKSISTSDKDGIIVEKYGPKGGTQRPNLSPRHKQRQSTSSDNQWWPNPSTLTHAPNPPSYCTKNKLPSEFTIGPNTLVLTQAHTCDVYEETSQSRPEIILHNPLLRLTNCFIVGVVHPPNDKSPSRNDLKLGLEPSELYQTDTPLNSVDVYVVEPNTVSHTS
jgi:hypothetical protein